MTRAVVVAGAGGVGKTTVAAGLGVTAAAAGKRTLVLTVDPAPRLAEALGVELSNQPQELGAVNGLCAAMLDAAAAWETVVHRHTDPVTAQRLTEHDLFRAVAERFPSGQAYAACDQMTDFVTSGTWDVVVVDTPPAAGGVDFFLAPSRMRDLVGGRVLRWLTGGIVPGRKLVFRWTARPMLRLADSVLGGPFLQQVAEFLLDLRTTYDGLRRRSRAMERVLRAASTLVVTTPDPGPVAEADRFFRELGDVTGPPAALVINKMLPAEWATAGEPQGASPAVAANFSRWADEARRQQDALLELQSRYLEPVVLPWTAQPPVDVAGIERLVAPADQLGRLVT